MDWIAKFVCIIGVVFVVGIVVAIITDLVKSYWYGDVRDLDDMLENKRAINHTDKESDNKRADYLFCMRNINIIGSDDISSSMRKIDKYLTSYELEQFSRFYAVYCKELSNILKEIKDCKCSSLYYSLVTETRTTYGSIFSKMLTDIETTIKNSTTSDTDIEGIKNFAKINGDFDENYRTETVGSSVGDATLTPTTSAVGNMAENYAASLARAYEKISQCEKENTQLTKELEKCRAEAKRCTRESNLARIDRVIDYRERSGRNDAALKLMRKTRDEIAGNTYRDSDFAYRLYANWVTDYAYDYSDSHFLYDEWTKEWSI